MRRPFRGLGAILFKEFIVVLRDPMTLFFMLFPPLIEMIAFGYALDNDVKHMAMVVFNEDRTVESRQLLDRFVNTETFRIVREVGSATALASEIRAGHAYVGIANPASFHARPPRRTPRPGTTLDRRLQFHRCAAGAQYRGRDRPHAIDRNALERERPRAWCRSKSGRKCSTTRRCGALTFSSRA